MPGPESASMLQRALAHWDPQTRRTAAREIGRTNRVEALPALLRLLDEVYFFERNYELKKEVLKSLESMRPAQAKGVLTRMAKRRFVIGKKNRELRYLAQRTLSLLESPPA
jgi:HEAT repeat protein